MYIYRLFIDYYCLLHVNHAKALRLIFNISEKNFFLTLNIQLLINTS